MSILKAIRNFFTPKKVTSWPVGLMMVDANSKSYLVWKPQPANFWESTDDFNYPQSTMKIINQAKVPPGCLLLIPLDEVKK